MNSKTEGLPAHEIMLVNKDNERESIAFCDCETIDEIKTIVNNYLKYEENIENLIGVIYRNHKTGFIFFIDINNIL